MVFFKYIALFIFGFPFLLAENFLSLDQSYDELVTNIISVEKQYELANSAIKFGLYSTASEIYESLLDTNDGKKNYLDINELHFALINSYIGNRNFELAKGVLNEIPPEEQDDRYFLYNLIIEYIQNYKRPKNDILELLKSNLKLISYENLDDNAKAWYFYFKATEELIRGKKSDIKNSLFQAKIVSGPDADRKAFFDSLILRLQYNIQKPSVKTLRQLNNLLKSNKNKKQAYYYAYDYAYLLAIRGDRNRAIDVINKELLKGETFYSLYQLDNLRLLKVVVLGSNSISGRDLIFTIIQSSKDNLILDLSFRLLKEYFSQTNDSEFLETLSLYFENQKLHPLRFSFYKFKAKFLLNKVKDDIAQKDEALRSLALNKLNLELQFILDNFPGAESLEDVYRMLVYVALNMPSPQYRLAADYLNRILDFTTDSVARQKLNTLIGNCYFLNDDFEVSAEFFTDALSDGGLWHEGSKGQLWFRMITAKIRANLVNGDLIKSIEEGLFAKEIPIEIYLKIQWNLALFYRQAGKYSDAVNLINAALDRINLYKVPVILDVRFKWFSLYLKYLSGYNNRASILEAQLLINRLNQLEESDIEEEKLLLLKSQVMLLKAQFLLSENQTDQATLVVEKLQNTFPNTQAAELSYIILAEYFTMSEAYEQAESYLLKLAKNYPESKFAAEALLEAAINAGKSDTNGFQKSIQLLNQLVNSYEESPLVFFAIRYQGDLLRKAGDFSGALSVYDNLIQKFPDHPNRYLADLSRVDCSLALVNQNPNSDLKEIILELERLLDLPDLPLEFQLEVRYKLALTLSKVNQVNLSNKIVLYILNDSFFSNLRDGSYSEIESYWISRSLFLLCEHFNLKKEFSESKKIYRIISAYDLPGHELAKQLILEL